MGNGLISQKKVYDAKCKAELYLEGKVLKSMRDIVGIHDGTVAVKEIDLGITIDTLMRAAASGDLTLMIDAIDSGFGVNSRDPKTLMTPLMHAAQGGHFSCAVLLLGRGADMKLSDPMGKQAIHFACAAGKTRLIGELIKWEVDLQCMDVQGRNPLHYAYRDRHLHTAEMILAHGAEMNARNNLGCSVLHEACRYGLLECAVHQLDRGADIELVDNTGYSPLTMACEFGFVDVARLLVNRGCNVKMYDHLGRTPLHKAAEFDKADCVKLMIESGANKETQDKAYFTPLLTACQHGSSRCVEMLISLGSNMEAVEGGGMTGLHLAAFRGHVSVIRLMLMCSANVEATDNYGCTPIFYACKNFKVKSIIELVRWGANAGATTAAFTPFQLVTSNDRPFPHKILHRSPGLKELYRSRITDIHVLVEQGNVKHMLDHWSLQQNLESPDTYGETPLHYAARLGMLEIASTLLDLGGKIDCRDNWGFTPLHCACEGNHQEVAKLLLQRGADVETRSSVDKTPLHRACEYGRVEVVKVLLSYAADVTKKDALGRSPLHYAAMSKNMDLLVLVLDYGTDAMLTDTNGETILHQACRFNDKNTLKLLISRKVALNMKDYLGKTAFLHAAEHGNTECVKILLKAGADPKIGNKWNAVGLHYACANNHLHTAVTILKAALMRPPNGVLMSVLRHNKSKLFDENIEMVNLLKEDCCIDDVDISGETSLFKACYRGHLKIVEVLLDRGADISIKAEDLYPFDLLKPGKDRESLERLAAKVSRFVVRIKFENNIDVFGVTPQEGGVRVPKTKKVTEVNELTSMADMDAFHKAAVVAPKDFEINLRDISNKIRLLSLRRLDTIKEAKALCSCPYTYHKELKARVIRLAQLGSVAYNSKDKERAMTLWEEACQLQLLKDWIGRALLRDRPVDKVQSDRLFDICRLLTIFLTKKSATHADHLDLLSRIDMTLRGFDNKDVEYLVVEAEKKKKKKKKRRNKKNVL